LISCTKEKYGDEPPVSLYSIATHYDSNWDAEAQYVTNLGLIKTEQERTYYLQVIQNEPIRVFNGRIIRGEWFCPPDRTFMRLQLK